MGRIKDVIILRETLRGPDVDDTWPAPYPSAVTLITAADRSGIPNIMPAVSATVINRFPFMVGVAIARARYARHYVRRYTHYLVQETGEFVANIPDDSLRKAIELCGNTSGRDVDKFKLTGLTPVPGLWVRAPLIAECPINFECEVRAVLNLGSHDYFIGEVVVIHKERGLSLTSRLEEAGEGALLWEAVPRRVRARGAER